MKNYDARKLPAPECFTASFPGGAPDGLQSTPVRRAPSEPLAWHQLTTPDKQMALNLYDVLRDGSRRVDGQVCSVVPNYCVCGACSPGACRTVKICRLEWPSGRVAYRVRAYCRASLWAVTVARYRESKRRAKLWLGALGAPNCPKSWINCFAHYRAGRDGTRPQYRAIEAEFQAGTPGTLLDFIEFLNEYPERRRRWARQGWVLEDWHTPGTRDFKPLRRRALDGSRRAAWCVELPGPAADEPSGTPELAQQAVAAFEAVYLASMAQSETAHHCARDGHPCAQWPDLLILKPAQDVRVPSQHMIHVGARDVPVCFVPAPGGLACDVGGTRVEVPLDVPAPDLARLHRAIRRRNRRVTAF